MTYIVASRDALVKILHFIDPADSQEEIDPNVCSECARCAAEADRLIASGAVVDAATLADDEALIADTAYALAEGEATYAASTVRHVLRALAAALTERAQ